MTRKTSDLTLLKRLLFQVRPFWPHLFVLFVLGLLAAPLSLLLPVPLKLAVDHVLGSEPLPPFLQAMLPGSIQSSPALMILFAAALIMVINLLIYIRGMLDWLLQTYAGEKMVLIFRSKILAHVQRLSFTYHDTQGTADSIYRVQYDTYAVQQVTLNGLLPMTASAFMLLSMLWVTFKIDVQIALVAVAITPVLLILTWLYQNRIRESWSAVKKHQSAAMSVVQEVLTSVRVVKAYGQEEREHDRFMDKSIQSLNRQIHAAFLGSGFDLAVGLTLALGTAWVLALGVTHVRQGLLTLGDLLMVMAYLTQLYRPLEKISKNVTGLQSSLASAERVFALLDEIPEVTEKPHAKSILKSKGHLQFKNVSFAYEKRTMVLNDVSLDVAPGRRVGIAGQTGAGKTTLISLLMRFYDPTSGTILLDGIDLRDYKLADLRRQFAIVLQEPVLFSTTIAENIAYANPSASESEVIRAAQAAHAHEFITKLADGYQTKVGERGMKLSGGERQRIALARAFLKNAPILIFDEPTSSVDMKTESLIIDAMKRLMEGRTTFMIAHRLSTLEHCDLRLNLESGRILSTEETSSVEAHSFGAPVKSHV